MLDRFAGSNTKSNVNLTAAASTLLPSWNRTFFLSLNVYRRPSGETCHDSAASGMNLPSGVMLTSPQPTFIATQAIS